MTLDEGAQADYQRALDAYEDAKVSGDAMTAPDDIRHVTGILDDGRYAIACVRARVAGEPLPTRRPPCFFDPRHGPSVTDVDYAPAGGATRSVPSCALDAERVGAGADPDVRQVMVGSRRVPYWQGGPAYAPYAAGYFAAGAGMSLLFGGLLIGSMGGWGFGDGRGDHGGGDSVATPALTRVVTDGDGGGDGGGDAGGGDLGGDMGGFGDFGGSASTSELADGVAPTWSSGERPDPAAGLARAARRTRPGPEPRRRRGTARSEPADHVHAEDLLGGAQPAVDPELVPDPQQLAGGADHRRAHLEVAAGGDLVEVPDVRLDRVERGVVRLAVRRRRSRPCP